MDQLSYVMHHRRPRARVGRAMGWVSIVAGGALAAYGLKQRSSRGGAAAIAGAALLYHGARAHRRPSAGRVPLGPPGVPVDPPNPAPPKPESDTRARLGGERGTLVEESITIRRGIRDVYGFWRRLENLPRFLGHLSSVTVRPTGISHWVAKGPAGLPVEWDARIINEVENERIGWQSLDGSPVATAGSVRFTETILGTTVRVRFQYDPPGGRLGTAVAALFGEDPRRSVRDDLRRLKRLLESHADVSARDSSPQPSV